MITTPKKIAVKLDVPDGATHYYVEHVRQTNSVELWGTIDGICCVWSSVMKEWVVMPCKTLPAYLTPIEVIE